MSEYTPTTSQVKYKYIEDTVPVETGKTEFDRWLAKEKAESWDEGLGAGRDRWMDSREFGDRPANPYRK